jgi:hypothetical protein
MGEGDHVIPIGPRHENTCPRVLHSKRACGALLRDMPRTIGSRSCGAPLFAPHALHIKKGMWRTLRKLAFFLASFTTSRLNPARFRASNHVAAHLRCSVSDFEPGWRVSLSRRTSPVSPHWRHTVSGGTGSKERNRYMAAASSAVTASALDCCGGNGSTTFSAPAFARSISVLLAGVPHPVSHFRLAWDRY